MDLAPYFSPDAREAELDRLAAALGGELRVLGRSVEGRDIRAVRIPGASEDRVLVCAGIHGVEFIGNHVALGVLRALHEGDPAWKGLRARAEVWVLPSLNPDAYARTWERKGVGSIAELRVNARGVDLNRNFPLPGEQRKLWITFDGWRTGSDDPANAFYRGTGPLSEPETTALARLLDDFPFRASANLHSSMGTLIQPHVPGSPDFAAYGKLCKAFRSGQKRTSYRRMASRLLDVFTGEQEDYQHHVHRTWALCVEHYPLWVDPWRFMRRGPLFWRFNPRQPEVWIRNDIGGIASYFSAALDMGPPGGP